MTPNFQIWYLTSMDMILKEQEGRHRSDTSPVCPLTRPWLMCLSHHVSSPGGGSGLRSLWAVISREARSMPSNSAIRSRPKMSPCLSRTCRRKPQAMKKSWSWKRGHCLYRGSRDAQFCMRNRGSIFLERPDFCRSPGGKSNIRQ